MADRPARQLRTWFTPEHIVLAVAAAAAFATYVVLARGLWFYSDEWDYVVERDITGDPTSLFWPHNDQWQTIPVVVFRALLSATGIRTYLPFLVLMVAVYVASCLLVHAVMVRAGVHRWVAVALTVSLLFLGSANENAVFAAQLTYMGSVGFGFAALLVAMGPTSRRQLVAVSFLGLAAVMCSNIGVVMVGLVTIWLWFNRGLRPALLTVALPAAAFLAWWSHYRVGRGVDLSGAAGFVREGLAGTGDSFGQRGGWGTLVLLALFALGALAAATTRMGSRHWRTALPLVLAAVGFLAVTGSQRASAFGEEAARQTRYTGVVIFLLAPAAGLAATVLARRWRPVGAVAIVVLLMGLPGNLSDLDSIRRRVDNSDRARELIVALPLAEGFATAPEDQRPFPESWLAPQLTVGYVRDAAASGDLPAHRGATEPVDEGSVRLALYQTWTASSTDQCEELTDPVVLGLSHGQRVAIDGGFVRVSSSLPDGRAARLYFNPNRGDAIEVLGSQVTVELSTFGVNGPARLCGVVG